MNPTPESLPSAPGVDLDWLAQRIEYRRFQECIHCGLCTASCPTYLETGNENDSPRGRIYLMRSVTDGRMALSAAVRTHLDLCLDCRACETACPSGVQYGRLIEPYKLAMQKAPAPAGPGKPGWLLRTILHKLFAYPDRMRAALAPVRLLQAIGLYGVMERVGLFRILPGPLGPMAAMLPPRLPRGERLPELAPAIGPRRARVALLTGCVADVMYPGTNAATVRVLQRNGCEVVVPRGQGCCGAIHYHSGDEASALALVRKNLAAFDPASFDAVIVNAAGCGAMMKEYPHVVPEAEREAARRLKAKVRDVAEFLVELGPIPPRGRLDLEVTYHDPCHLAHAQKVRDQPRQLLELIPGLVLKPLPESEVCCGAAGTYNLTQPEMSRRLGERKLGFIAQTGATIVATGNVGCLMQIAKVARAAGATIEIVHPIDLLDRSYAAEGRDAGVPAREPEAAATR